MGPVTTTTSKTTATKGPPLAAIGRPWQHCGDPQFGNTCVRMTTKASLPVMAGLVVQQLQGYLPSLPAAVNATGLVLPAMHALSKLVVLGSAVQGVFGLPDAAARARREAVLTKRAVDSYIENQRPIAWEKLLCNIGPNGCAAAGVASGIIIASPSKHDPDYFYTWTRDAGLVVAGLVDSFAHNYSSILQTTIQNFVVSQAKLQTVTNPSGRFADGTGLAEPKFEVNLTPFTGEWGRPQRDGPPLRAIALTRYAKWLVANGYKDTAKNVVWPVIKNDLTYTAQYWNETGFDLWEEVPGSSFFTIASSHRALVEGALLATQLDTECRACVTVAPDVLCFQQSFWKQSAGHIVSNINGGEYRSGKDANSILVATHNFDPEAGCDSTTFQPCSDRALSNHKNYVDSFRSIYSINRGIPQGKAVAVGRYAEDIFYNGNPWYLATFAAAEQLYDALYVWDKQGKIDVTPLSLAFFRDHVPSVSTGSYAKGSSMYNSIVNAVSAYADGFFEVAAKYTPSNGALSEQYDRNHGGQTSARDLTWSYSAFLVAAERRAGIIPDSWGAALVKNSLPSQCSRAQVAGTYVAATATSFPANQTPNPTPTPPVSLPNTCANPNEVYVTFNERVSTQWGETIKVVGSVPELGNWDISKAVTLSASGYTSSDPLWSLTVPITGNGKTVEYKYIKISNGNVVWESDPNRRVTLRGASSQGGCAAQSVYDHWR
ncbi:hypothetical protein VTJ83DRAFT_6475 [Remersonia thermophila]|uniref:glucan 1,4-alpha-glucosidase n=1 Tax=Remersonia thermophila TaxID=72144 RepID=A0ABR4D4S6_9PEZI